MEEEKYVKPADAKLVEFVIGHTDEWKSNARTNYYETWDEYERLWLGIFEESDRTRTSERSKIITPAIQQAIETYQAEIEEAVFGRGQYFDIEDDSSDEDQMDMVMLRAQMHDDFKKNQIETNMSQVITLAAVFGTGIGEITVKTKTDYKPTTMKVEMMNVGGLQESDRFCVHLKPVHPKNFIIDPNATSVEDAMGCAVEEYVSIHSIKMSQKKGIYRDVYVGTEGTDDDLVPFSQEEDVNANNKVRILKYYGLVPAGLVEGVKAMDEDTAEDIEDGSEDMYEEMVEAIIVIANGGVLLKAEESPYMMKDRPIVYWSPEPLPGRFWGRGIAQKGFNMQKALDAQMRAHLDRLALVTAPMVKADATRLPRGFKFEVKPARMLLTNGDPDTVIKPFEFGAPDTQNVETAKMFERMLLQATGTLDAAGMPSDIGQNSQPGALGLAMSGIIKKNKKSLMHFQDKFLIPFIQKAAWRFMQYDPERYPMRDYKFIPMSSLGIMAREFEQQQYMAMLSTLGPDSPIVPLLMKSIVMNSSLSDREALAKQLDEMSKPDPKQQQMQEQAMQLDMQGKAAQVKDMEASAQEKMARAVKAIEETKAIPEELKIKLIQALSFNSEEPDEFGQKAQYAELLLKEKDLELKEVDIASNERIAKMQTESTLVQKIQDAEDKEEDRKLKREEIKARRAEKQIVRDKDGNMSGVKTKE